jgi:hypothetical protein
MSKFRREDALQCSFCHKSQDTVGKLISSPSDYPRAYICDECIAVCYSILEDDGGQAHQTESAKESETPRHPSPLFILQHAGRTNDNEEDVKLIGIYSTQVRAEEAVCRLRSKPGFRDASEGFSIQAYPVDHDDWAEGFVTEQNDSQ